MYCKRYRACGFNSHSRGKEIFNLFISTVTRQRVALSSATQHAMAPEFDAMSGIQGGLKKK